MIAKPFLKWAGGKTQLIKQIEKQLPTNILNQSFTFIEPFVGSGAVLFWMLEKFPNLERAIINDINADLTNCYVTIKDNVNDLINTLAEWQDEYYNIAKSKNSVAKIVFERIAREGRKYGISLIVCSQRPSELSKTVLSQCNSFIIHRLQNPEDQKYIRGLVSSANADILNQLPIIPQQHAIITGDCVRTAIQVRIDNVSPTPNSNNPRYIEQWLTDLKIPYEETCKRWLGNLESESANNDKTETNE